MQINPLRPCPAHDEPCATFTTAGQTRPNIATEHRGLNNCIPLASAQESLGGRVSRYVAFPAPSPRGAAKPHAPAGCLNLSLPLAWRSWDSVRNFLILSDGIAKEIPAVTFRVFIPITSPSCKARRKWLREHGRVYVKTHS